MSVAIERPRTVRLLDGLVPGRRADLAAHRAVHGSLILPSRSDDRWSEHLVDELAGSGLTGRGGAGFPTADKIRWIRAQRRRPVLAVNAMEGEPASRKDAVLATHVPHLVLDGAAAVARCVDAASVRVCVPRQADAVAASLDAAMRERSRTGMDPVPVELVRPPGGYVSGEESALAAWLDRHEALPSFRPDRPAVVRVGGRPCLVDNAETLARVALVARHGGAAVRGSGNDESAGSALVTVSGAVARTGVYEVPLGVSVGSILSTAGGAQSPLSAVLLGGYGGSWLPADRLGLGFDAKSLRAAGASPGAGVVVALPADSCGLAETARVAAWMAREGAGQCGPCVFGLPAVADDLGQLAFGRAGTADLARLECRLATVDGRGACRHPDGVARLVRSALAVFQDDLRRHLRAGPCSGAWRAGVLPTPGLPAPSGRHL
jgi:NADH:ubiquinone oxidoreductase subunit F (NADH-binding)